jgi:hypothetical protein
MLTGVIHWTATAGLVLEVLLLFRLLALKLQKTYAFVTLYWAVSIIIDSAQCFFGWDSKESTQIGLHQPLLLALIYPLLVWDVFEEIRPKVATVMRFQATRMISGLVVTVIMSGLWSLFFLDELRKTAGGPFVQFGLFLWLGSMSVSALFLISVYRAAKVQHVSLARNTTVWLGLAAVVLAADVIYFVVLLAAPVLSQNASQVITLLLELASIAVTLWCVFRMRPVPEGVTSQPERASL